MTSPRHVVLRQIVEVTVPAKRQVQRVHDSLSRACRAGVAQILERQADRLSGAGTVHRIDRLEVNLGRVRLDELEKAFEAALRVQLAEAIRRLEREAGGECASRVASQFELIDHFFRTGTLPWWADDSSPRPWADGLRFLAREAAPELRQWLRELTRNARSLRRLIVSSTDAELGEWVNVLAPNANSIGGAWAGELTSAIQSLEVSIPAGTARVAIWRGILVTVARESAWPDETNRWLREILVGVAAAVGLPLARLVPKLRSRLEAHEDAAIAEWSRALQSLKQESDSADLAEPAEWLAWAPEASSSAPPEGAAAVESALREWRRPETGASRARILRPVSRSRFSESDGVFVNNAGLVLLWPFLASFLQRLGLLEEKRFKSDSAQQRAVGLLQFIVDGNLEPPPEHWLPLNKLLCGLPTDELFEMGDAVNETEVEESNAVLRAVIEQAPMLGKISSDGFRGSFLLRRGQLRVHEESALLRVERQTYDIVLERLPWTVNWVRLPWMNLALQVEWL